MVEVLQSGILIGLVPTTILGIIGSIIWCYYGGTQVFV